jgi:GntR family transcriptional repressor for pyruvate dehydrogenase complex
MKRIERTSVTDIVVENLKELIMTGNIPVGGKLPTEKEISETLNVGRSTVREALRVLQAMGFVEMKPGKGAFVAKIKEDDQNSIENWFAEHKFQITDFMEVRIALETLAVKLAVNRATEEEIQAIEENFKEFSKAIEDNDSNKLAYLDEAFHRSITNATHNYLLISINKKISDAFRAYRMKSFSHKGIAKNALMPHKDIVDALKTRDAEKGIKAMTEHIRISLEDVYSVAGNVKPPLFCSCILNHRA